MQRDNSDSTASFFERFPTTNPQGQKKSLSFQIHLPKLSNFNEKIGSYKLNIERKNIFVFLSGILTGQGALDTFSFERLKWHIKHINNGTLKIY